MAEQILFNFTEKILLKLASTALQQIGLAWGVTKELGKLEKTISTVRNVLLDAQEQQTGNRAVREWLERLKDIVYDVDDLVDEFATEALQREVEIRGSKRREVRYFFTRSNPFKFRFGMGRKIRDVRERLDEVVVDMGSFNFVVRVVDMSVKNRAREETYSFIPSSDVIGRENDKKAIVQLLMHSTDRENVSIIPIVGLGGLGKTTLAQLVYNDKRIQSQFHKKSWVCISDDFDTTKIIGKILKVNGGTGSDNLGIEQLQSSLRQILGNKKYFLVLDDVWNEDLVKWRNLRDLLMVGARGSKIIVTTRSKRVAEIMGTVPSYVLKGLSNDDCLSVLLKWAFKQGDEEKHQDLVNIGREIVKKCGGVPLAARTLGAFLNSKIDKQHWLSVRDSEIWTIVQKENDILPILKLSYDQMPSYLKQCFAYCSMIIEKDERFLKFSLIYFWMAHGFIQSPAQNEELEDTGESYFNELVRRSFIEVAEEEEEEFKMHDLVHDLAQFVAGSECLTIKSTTKSIPERVRHVNFDSSLHEEFPRPLLDVKKLRTILLPFQLGPTFQSITTSLISNFGFLRVLVFYNLNFKVPSSIGDLKHLRLFSLTMNDDAKTLPESFGRLVNLQFLDLTETYLRELPKTFENLINLRVLNFSTTSTSLREKVIGRLTSLRTLVICYSDELTSLTERIGKITGLQILDVTRCPKLASFPSSMRHLTALKELRVAHCPNLVTLSESFASLASLRTVEIINCPKLLSLPDRIDRVPVVKIDGMDLNTFNLICSARHPVQSNFDDW
ncbi:hypothetical protein F0562_015502 [Nyssa sinensis]|uniref:Disease resistance protein RGA3 n=1 Tax=Nyssa sinensis TaxID=561372 RepID=A0A5J4ZL75_9ASTE|nr:hypothetical protein F0562_015502 [Nyssa sinensis]